MTSLARTLDAAALLARMNRNPGIGMNAYSGTFLTADDARIFQIEGSITLFRSMAARHLADAHFCRDHGNREGITRHLTAVKHCRKQAREMADKLDGVVAERDRKVA